jgi:hypothetical protein
MNKIEATIKNTFPRIPLIINLSLGFATAKSYHQAMASSLLSKNIHEIYLIKSIPNGESFMKLLSLISACSVIANNLKPSQSTRIFYYKLVRRSVMKNYTSVTVSLGFILAAFIFPGFAAAEVVHELGQLPPPTALELLSSDELNNLVAPVALYPDPLLSQILVASTYPLEVVEANQWLQRNGNLRGEELLDAAKQQTWDPSVQALIAVPDAMAMLNQDIRWTTDLGNAFLSQEADVMKAVQRMRARAQSNGRLSSTPQQIVTAESQGKNQVVKIMPAEPDVIYVPVYDPVYIWGPPVYGYYPPLFYPPFSFTFGIGCRLAYFFSDWGGWGNWGWGPNWFGNVIVINNGFFHRHGFYERPGWHSRDGNWTHNPDHRKNVPYKNTDVANRFGGRASVSRTYIAENRPSGRTVDQEQRSTPPRSQNPARERYQSSTQYQPPTQYREAPEVQRRQDQTQRSYQSPQYRPAPQQDREPQVQRYREPQVQQYREPQVREYRAPQVQQYREPQVREYRTPQVQQYRAPQVQQYREPQVQQYRAPQVQQYRAPQVQQYRAQPNYQAPSQSRPAPHEGGASNRPR